MNETIVVALITGGAAIISNIITANKSSRELNFKLEKQQAVTDTKIEELTREVRAHNNFAQRMPVVESKIETLTDTVGELKKYHME